MGFNYRALASVLRPQALEWSEQHAGFWDDAIKGSSPLRAALRRNLNMEAAILLSRSFSIALTWSTFGTSGTI